MTASLQQLLASSRSLLDESSGNFYTDSELTTWINDGLRDIARRTEDIQHFDTTIAAISGTGNYALPSALIRLHRVDFQATGDVRQYPMELVDRNDVDRLIGFNPTIQSSFPFVAWLWGTPGNSTYPLTMSVYPVPSTGGTFNLYYFRMPNLLINPTDVAEIPNGWEDLVPLFTEAMAKRKDRDPSWQDAKQEYESRLQVMIEQTRFWHDGARQVLGERGRWTMDWLYSFDW